MGGRLFARTTCRTLSIKVDGDSVFQISDQSARPSYRAAKTFTLPLTFSKKSRSISLTVPTVIVEKSNFSTRNEFASGVGSLPMSKRPKSSWNLSLRLTS